MSASSTTELRSFLGIAAKASSTGAKTVNSSLLSVSTRSTLGFSLPETALVSVLSIGLFEAATATGSCAMPLTEPAPSGTILAYASQPGPTRFAAGSMSSDMAEEDEPEDSDIGADDMGADEEDSIGIDEDSPDPASLPPAQALRLRDPTASRPKSAAYLRFMVFMTFLLAGAAVAAMVPFPRRGGLSWSHSEPRRGRIGSGPKNFQSLEPHGVYPAACHLVQPQAWGELPIARASPTALESSYRHRSCFPPKIAPMPITFCRRRSGVHPGRLPCIPTPCVAEVPSAPRHPLPRQA